MATAKGAARRDAIITAAADLLVADGLEAVTHRSVAARAGVPLGSTTYYFDALDDLRRAAADRIADADAARMAASVAELRPRSRNATTTARMIVGLVTPPGEHELITWYERYARAAREPVLTEAARRTNRAATEAVAAVVEASGWGRHVEPDVVLAVVDGAVLGSLADGAGPAAARTRAGATLADLLTTLTTPPPVPS